MGDGSFAPDWFSKPGDTLAALMVRRAFTVKRLAEKLGCDAAMVRGLLTGTVAIDKDIAARLSHCVGGTPSFWQKRQDIYERALARAAAAIPEDKGAAWLKKLPRKDMGSYGWIHKPTRRADMLKTYLTYFGVTGPREWEERYTDFMAEVAFRTSPAFKSKIGALSAWLRQGEIEAALVQCGPWSADVLKEGLGELRKLSKAKVPAYFVPRLREICAASGIAVVFVRAPAGCRASGAARFVSPDKAIIVLSFRHLSDDHFWFTFFHEVGHLVLHGRSSTFIDGEAEVSNRKEREANAFAAGVLVPQDRHEELVNLRPRTESVVRFAVSVGVSPGVIVGQMQHADLISRKQLNFLKRRYKWEQISAAFA